MLEPNYYYNQSSRVVTTVVAPYPIAAPLTKGYHRAESSYYGNTRRQAGAQHRSMAINHTNGINKTYQNHTLNSIPNNPYTLNRKANTHKWTANKPYKRPFRSVNLSVVNTNKTHFLSQNNFSITVNNVPLDNTKYEQFNKTWEQGKEFDNLTKKVTHKPPSPHYSFNEQNKKETTDYDLKRIQLMNYERLKRQLDEVEKRIDGNKDHFQTYQIACIEKERFNTIYEQNYNNQINEIKRELKTETICYEINKLHDCKTEWNTFEGQWVEGNNEDKIFGNNNGLIKILKTSLSPVETMKVDEVSKSTEWKAYKEEKFKTQMYHSEAIAQNFNNQMSTISNTKQKSKNSEINQTGNEIVKEIYKVDLLDKESLTVKQPGLVDILYSGVQCSGCDARFSAKDTLRYSQHLDWHFRQNRRDKEATRKAQRRTWFYSLDDWTNSAELQEKQETEPMNFFEQSRSKAKPAEESSAPAPPGHSYCTLCGDEFQVFFHDDFDEWRCRNAVYQDGKIYHPECLKSKVSNSKVVASSI